MRWVNRYKCCLQLCLVYAISNKLHLGYLVPLSWLLFSFEFHFFFLLLSL